MFGQLNRFNLLLSFMVFVFGDDNIFNEERNWIHILCVELIMVLSRCWVVLMWLCVFMEKEECSSLFYSWFYRIIGGVQKYLYAACSGSWWNNFIIHSNVVAFNQGNFIRAGCTVICNSTLCRATFSLKSQATMLFLAVQSCSIGDLKLIGKLKTHCYCNSLQLSKLNHISVLV